MNDQALIDMIRSLADPGDARHVARVEAAAVRVERRLGGDRRRSADQEVADRLVSLELDGYDFWRTLAKEHAHQADTDAVLSDVLARLTALEVLVQRLGGGGGVA